MTRLAKEKIISVTNEVVVDVTRILEFAALVDAAPAKSSELPSATNLGQLMMPVVVK